MPLIHVMALVANDAGELIWAYEKKEVLRAGPDAEQNALRMLDRVTTFIDEASTSIPEQAKPDLENVAREQEEEERGR